MEEGGAGNGHPYTAFWQGYHQLTWAGNYRGYGEFKTSHSIQALTLTEELPEHHSTPGLGRNTYHMVTTL